MGEGVEGMVEAAEVVVEVAGGVKKKHPPARVVIDAGGRLMVVVVAKEDIGLVVIKEAAALSAEGGLDAIALAEEEVPPEEVGEGGEDLLHLPFSHPYQRARREPQLPQPRHRRVPHPVPGEHLPQLPRLTTLLCSAPFLPLRRFLPFLSRRRCGFHRTARRRRWWVPLEDVGREGVPRIH